MATRTKTQRRLSRRTRNALLTAHIIVAVGLLGDSAGFLAVAVRRAVTTDPDLEREAPTMLIDGNRDEVLDLVRRWAAAEQGNDAGLLGGLVTDDFVGVGPLGVEDPQVRDYGTAAVVVGVQAQEASFQGGDNSGRFRLTLGAVRPAERWLVAGVHIGPLQGPAGPSSG